jgi:hypothetical protein
MGFFAGLWRRLNGRRFAGDPALTGPLPRENKLQRDVEMEQIRLADERLRSQLQERGIDLDQVRLADERRRSYLQERGIEEPLRSDEVPFAVVWPTTEDPGSLRELGEHLQAWLETNRGAKRILGLSRLLEGRVPEVSTYLLCIPISPDEVDSWISRVALVTVARKANLKQLGTSLGDAIDRVGTAGAASYEDYSRWNR